jgi:hypothetical protein
MPPDIFEFWSRMPLGANIHPDDQPIFDRLNPKKHGFQLGCLPASFNGPLTDSSPNTSLSSPGFEGHEVRDAKTPECQDYYFRRCNEPIRADASWAKSRTACFGNWEDLRHKVAVRLSLKNIQRLFCLGSTSK